MPKESSSSRSISGQIVQQLRKLLDVLRQPLIATLFGLLLGSIVILATGHEPFSVYGDMFKKSFFGSFYFLQTLTRATPIIIAGLATIISWRAGYINIGVEGQMIVGCFVATAVAIYVPGSAFFVKALAMLCGMLAAALYASLAALLNHKFRVSLVICTLMMNYIANYTVSYFVNGPMKDTKGDGIAVQTVALGEGLRFTRLFPKQTLNTGFIIAILLVAALIFMSKKTVFGYESKMTGLNPTFAKYGGVRDTRVMYATLALSGAIAALGGITEVFGVSQRYVDDMITSNSYAWTGLMAALIAALNPLGVFLSSIFLAGLQVGGQSLQRTANIPLQLSTIIQTSITLFISVKFAFSGGKLKVFLRRRLGSKIPHTPQSLQEVDDSLPQAERAVPVQSQEETTDTIQPNEASAHSAKAHADEAATQPEGEK